MKIKKVTQLAYRLGIRKRELIPYGDYMAKVDISILDRIKNKPDGHLVFITSINPTPRGEGKTTTAIGLTQALGRMNEKVMLCLRQPSLGPVFGVKGGATGGGKSSLYPAEDINLHFTGDCHAVSTAHNLVSAALANHIYWGNKFKIKDIIWNRAIDISDRALRKIQVGLSIKREGFPYQDNFIITSASELMAILALYKSLPELRKMLAQIILAICQDGRPLFLKEMKLVPALLYILKSAINPNLVQTLEGNPVFVHAGPFANIAHGNSSLIATRIALKLADIVITEGGFGSELGLEKFIHITARKADFKISAVVIVVSVRALKYHGNSDFKRGLPLIKKHVEIARKFNLSPLICINRFPDDKQKELEYVKKYCHQELKIPAEFSEVYEKGGRGGLKLAEKVLEIISDNKPGIKFLYNLNESIKDKIEKIATNIYSAQGVEYLPRADEKISYLESQGLTKLPVNMAKTQFSLTHDSSIKGVPPQDWVLKIRDVLIYNGAGFITPVTGKILLLPGLPEKPNYKKFKFKDGKITGLL
jgi:formate--tetrahydrofolate ligase